jgi:hypothetical protein
MSSVQTFLRQRNTGQTLLPLAGNEALYVMFPGVGNYVGNYPTAPTATNPGAVVSVGAPSLRNDTQYYLRDMGKTIFAALGTAAGPSAGQTPGYFREVQVITPSTVASATSSVTFGVGAPPVIASNLGIPGTLPAPGGNAGDSGYNTFYIPIVVGGVIASGVSLSPAGIRISEQL